MTMIVLLLMGFTALASLAVLAQSVRRAVFAWNELQHALATCPERRPGRITLIELRATVPAERAPLRHVRFAGARPSQPVLRAAA